MPDTNIDSDIMVYIEDEKGTLIDSGGRRWRLALPSEYAAGRVLGLLDLSVRPEGMVAVSYSKGGNPQPWLLSMPGYLNEVEKWFNQSRSVNLGDYPMPQDIIIDGKPALVIHEKGTFSPFEKQNRYDAPSSTSQQADIVRLSNGNIISGYELVPLDINAASADVPLYAAAVSQRNVYELLSAQKGLTARSPASMWPLAGEFPEIYLSSARVFSGDAALRFTNYGSAGAFLIGTDVVSGSIQVWRSGIQDTNFSYNPSSGEVTLYGSTGANEIIRVTYLRQSDQTRLGSIAAGLGAVYRKGENPFSFQTALGLRWNLTENSSFTEENQGSQGTVGLSAKTSWDYDYLKAHIAAGFALEQTDTTGLYRAAGMEGNETVLSLPPETSFVSNPPASDKVSGLDTANRADLIYRNYYYNSVIGNNLMPIDWDGSSVVSNFNRPYPVRDSQLGDTHLIAAEFTLNDANKWTGFQVPLGFDASILSRAKEIEIPFRFYDFNGNTNNFDLIIQIGSLSGKDFAYNENKQLIWEEYLFQGGVSSFNGDLRITRFLLNEQDRARLGDAKYLRIIAVFNGIGEQLTGRVLLAPPIVRGAAFRAVTFDGNTVNSIQNMVTALETIDSGNTLQDAYRDTINRLHPTNGTQRVLKIEWQDIPQPGLSAGVDGRVGEIPLADYREISFFVKGEQPAVNNGTLSFIVASGPDTINDRQLEARIPMSAFKEGQWSKVTIRYQGNNTGVSVDGGDASGAWFEYKKNIRALERQSEKTSYVAVFVNPPEGQGLNGAAISIDEIILEDSSLFYRFNAGTGVEYSRPGNLLSVNGVDVLSDFKISTAAESEFREETGSMASRTGGEITILGTKVSGNFLFTAAPDTFLWNADHDIAGKWGPFYAGENFFASPYENSARHGVNFGVSSPFYAGFDADAYYNLSRLERKWNLKTGYRSAMDIIPSVSVSAQAAWTNNNEIIEDNEKYGDLWVRSWEPMVPDTGNGAETRKTSTQIIIAERTKPVGAIITLDGNTHFTNANGNTRLFNSAFLDVPVSIKNASVNFRSGRSFTRQLFFSGEDATKEGEKFFESIGDSLPLWSVFPFYSLFAPELNEAMDESLKSSPSFDMLQYTSFNDHFSARINLPGYYNLLAFVIPSNAGLRLERVMEQKLDTRSDMLNLGGSLGFSAINMFGSLGYKPIFKFYQSDEFTHAFESAFIFPREEETAWRIQSVAGMSFRGFSGGTLGLTNTATARSGGYWLENAAIDWTVPTRKSLLSVFYNMIVRAIERQNSWFYLSSVLNSEYEQLRKETLELTLDKTTDYYKWTLAAGHESIIRIVGSLNFSTFVKIRFNEDTYNEIFTVDGLLGITLRVIF